MTDAAEQRLLQSSENPPAQPSYVLRGHSAQVHAVHFYRGNTRLVTGDADGWIVIWSLSSKRAVAIWKAHTNTVLGVGNWGDDKIITHGRDSRIHTWQIRAEDENGYFTNLPIDSNDDSPQHKQPWLLHSLPVNALNFCSFTMIKTLEEGTHDLPTEGILLGTPGFQDGSINITSLPEESRIATIPKPAHVENAGMIMAIGLVFSSQHSSGKSKDLLILAGYESGHACIWTQPLPSKKAWQCVYTCKSHSQPILSLDIARSTGVFYTSGADAIIARHPLPTSAVEAKTLQTRHAGQQGLTVRNDEKIVATAGWDGRMRVYSTKGFKELAVLKWHKEGCYAIGFADVLDAQEGTDHVEGQDGDGQGLVKKESRITVVQRREAKARTTHWLAAGSKDGKVSLWDIY
ncbi:putative WD40/YVTN repeat-like-containing domain superfamily [Septoria linicola]|nr:putative WD40/YVTN repeat-like-containing domain superfamily [Septoria linicola]